MKNSGLLIALILFFGTNIFINYCPESILIKFSQNIKIRIISQMSIAPQCLMKLEPTIVFKELKFTYVFPSYNTVNKRRETTGSYNPIRIGRVEAYQYSDM